MSFQISKNKMSFVADNKQVSKKLTTTTEKVVENQKEMYEYMIENSYLALNKYDEKELIKNIKELING